MSLPFFSEVARTSAWGTLFALSLALLVGACVETDDTLPTEWRIRQVQQGIAGGEPDNDHPGVVGIFNNGLGGICSGTLIAPNLVLTAQHCVAPSTGSFVVCGSTAFGAAFAARSFTITTNPNLMQGIFRDSYKVREVVVPPGGNDLCGFDMALLVLSQNIPGTVAEPHTPRVDLNATPNETYSALGYGDTDEPGDHSGTRRIIGSRRVVCHGNDCPDFYNTFIRPTEWVGARGTCQGDSGGPAMDPQGRVFGVLSRGGDNCSSSIYSSVAPWSDWLREVGERAAELGGYTPAPWVTVGTSDDLPDADGDGIPDEFDNCPEDANADQADKDGDGIGDACDPVDDRDRGGSCTVCNGCSADSDCNIAGVNDNGLCLNLGSGGICTAACEVDRDCVGNTRCFQVGDGQGGTRGVCLNRDAGDAGICAEEWVCDATTAPTPDIVIRGNTRKGCTSAPGTPGSSSIVFAGLVLAFLIRRRR